MAAPETRSPATVCPLGRKGVPSPLEEREKRVTFARMRGRPFGYDTTGRPAAQVSGRLIRTAIETLHECVKQRVLEGPAAGAPESERAAAVSQAQEAALDELVSGLNSAIPDPGYHVTAAYLLNEGNRYSREMELFVNVLCQDISQDPAYYWKRGANAISPALAAIFRPFATRRVFEVVPRVTTRFVETDVRIVETTDSSAVLQWYGHLQQEGLPPELRTEWLEMSCPAFCGAYASIPARVNAAVAPADVKAMRCQRQGSECCEWRFSWRNAEPRPGAVTWGGVGASAVLGGLALLPFPGHVALAFAAPLPAAFAWHAFRMRGLAHAHDRQDRALAELQPLAEELHLRVEEAQAGLQLAELERARRADWLAALDGLSHAVGGAASPEVMLRAGLTALAEHNLFDRGLVLLVDRDQRLLVGSASVGGSPDSAARVAKLREPLDGSLFASVLETGGTALVTGDALRETSLGGFWVTLATRELAVIPLTVGGKPIGLLVADNTHTGRPVSDEDQRLLGAVANLLAAGVDRVRLRREVEGESTHPG
jgi:hypothetical protein